MIDSHCHLADKAFANDVLEVIARAHHAGVQRMICIADSLEEAERCIEIADTHEGISATVGIHPHNAKHVKGEDWIRMEEMLGKHKKICAIGEIGLDYHYDFSPRNVQQDVFRVQLRMAEERHLPAVIHCREAIADLKSILNEHAPKKFVLHCCTEKWDDVSDLVDKGHYLSFTGMATYPKAKEIHETIRQCPLSHMMIETDAPYLAPEKFRGKRNEPAYVKEVTRAIAELKGISMEEVADATEKNAIEFFRLL